ncbi:MAG: hypothetical protein JNM66_16720 [Bryobacterales bacterium]|nr:hypothetical protein [Bryobacterales bacterium]
MTDPLFDATRRVQRAWSADGLSELTAGFLFLAPALLEWSKLGFDKQDPAWRVLNVLQMLVVFPGVWIAQWALPRLRNRFFGSREGIMIPRLAPEGVAKAAAIAIVAAMTAAVFVAMRSAAHWVTLTILLSGFGAGFILFLIGRSTGLTRYLVAGPVIVLISAAIAALDRSFESLFVAEFGIIGAILTAMGVMSLRRFLQTPPSAAQ